MLKGSGCVLPDDVQEGFRNLYDDVSQMETDIGSLKQMLEVVSAAQEQGNTLSKELRDDVNQMKADISSLKQMLEEVHKVQGGGIALPNYQIWLIILAATFLIVYQIFTWFKVNDIYRGINKLDKRIKDKPIWRLYLEIASGSITVLSAILALLAMLWSNISGNGTPSSPNKMPPETQEVQDIPQQDLNLEATSSPADGGPS